VYRLFVRKQEENKPLGLRRYGDNIMIDLGEIGLDGVYWIGLAQDRDKWRALVNSVKNLRIP
jgi:hypothetical protein